MKGKRGNFRGKSNQGRPTGGQGNTRRDDQRGEKKEWRGNKNYSRGKSSEDDDRSGQRDGRRNKKTPFTNNKVKGERPQYEKSSKLQRADRRIAERSPGKKPKDDGIRLNKYIANAGVCSRRDADKLIEAGDVKVNKKVITEMGFKVQPGDKVTYKGKVLKNERPLYVLLNKPKDFITTTDDPQQRRTVMELVRQAGDERIFPVGRLDRQTTGLLLLTNDGELADKLAHPAKNIKKVYQVDLDKPITENDFNAIKEGFKLDDGPVEVDEVVVLDKDRKILGVEIHIGRNRIVRRIFEHFGYKVERLDRVYYAGLTKKDLPRGHWRYLSEEEVVRLKYLR